MLIASLDHGIAAAGVVHAPQAIAVDFDWTFLVVLVLFVALTLFLKPMLFDPMLALFEERERRIDGAKLLARRIDEKSAAAAAEYETGMARARNAANAEREKLHAEGVKREQEILARVRASTNQIIEDGKVKARAEADRARAALKADGAVLARQVASRVLGREVPS